MAATATATAATDAALFPGSHQHQDRDRQMHPLTSQAVSYQRKQPTRENMSVCWKCGSESVLHAQTPRQDSYCGKCDAHWHLCPVHPDKRNNWYWPRHGNTICSCNGPKNIVPISTVPKPQEPTRENIDVCWKCHSNTETRRCKCFRADCQCGKCGASWHLCPRHPEKRNNWYWPHPNTNCSCNGPKWMNLADFTHSNFNPYELTIETDVTDPVVTECSPAATATVIVTGQFADGHPAIMQVPASVVTPLPPPRRSERKRKLPKRFVPY